MKKYNGQELFVKLPFDSIEIEKDFCKNKLPSDIVQFVFRLII